MNPTLESALERTLAPAACVDLCLDDQFSPESCGDNLGLLRSVGDAARLRCDGEFCKKLPSLKFVDVHEVKQSYLHRQGLHEKRTPSKGGKK